ncbi:uncharacterized protein C4orf54 homolog [Ornithorhynchus anatinus]|uniref:uncharacterized protein C4orf54 homolog n=1 Tax=Ornithorhynchus anatinus TaxID=9258 RepID=UPI0010A8DAD8|nr:uncharacterized protein C4orf54 homolog [Ornithorhynchus anatinus]
MSRAGASVPPPRARPGPGGGPPRAKEPADRSSGASSAVSELDEADKEVRSLTSRAFRSLAYPSFEAPAVASREPSAAPPEGGPGRRSALLDLKGGTLDPREDPPRGPGGGRGRGAPAAPDRLPARAAKTQAKALDFVVSRVDGEIAHVEGGRPGPRGSDSASSLLKTVISKKMRREREFRLERGRGAQGDPDGTARERGPRPRAPARSEEGPGQTGAGGPEADGERAGPGSPTFRAGAPRETAGSPGPLRPGASEPVKGVFLRSRNSAFRSWKAREAEGREDGAPGGRTGLRPAGATVMSSLFVPALRPGGRAGPPAERASEPPAPAAAPEIEIRLGSVRPPGSDWDVAGPLGPPAERASKPPAPAAAPEIKIRLGSVRPPGSDCDVARLLGPPEAAAARPSGRPADRPAKLLRGDGLDRVLPQFLVRNVRDQARAPGPLHQVRDVRKLIKGAGEGGERGSVTPEGGLPGPGPRPAAAGPPGSSSPLVVTCQAVLRGKEAGGKAPRPRPASPEGTVLVHRASGRLPVATIAPNKTEGTHLPVLKIVAKAAALKSPERPRAVGREAPEEGDPREAAKGPPRNALEKLTAAVRTMEELYSFDRQEWRRRSQPPSSLADSHVLSLIASEERLKVAAEERPRGRPEPGPAAPQEEAPGAGGGPGRGPPRGPGGGPGGERLQRRNSNPGAESVSSRAAAFESLARQRPRSLYIPPAPGGPETPPRPPLRSPARPPQGPGAPGPAGQVGGPKGVPAAEGGPAGRFPRGPGLCSLKISSGPAPRKGDGEAKTPDRAGGDWGGYPALARKGGAAAGPRAAPGGAGWRGRAEPPGDPDARPPPAPNAPQPLPFGLPGVQPQLLCFTPPTLSPAPPAPATQRKVLLDLATGQCYLVDAPAPRPLTRRLFDPETGQYVDVPLAPPSRTPAPSPTAPVTPLSPVTPVPLLSPGAYGPAYVIYPGFLPAVLSSGALPLAPPGEPAPGTPGSKDPAEGSFAADPPYFITTGRSPPASSSSSSACPSSATAAAAGPSQLVGAKGYAQVHGKPVISVTSQPLGPRLVAPPSFDGTTMSFVVEHR